MAWLALGDALRQRCGSGCALCRPTLGREIGRDLAKILLRKAFGDRRHDRVVAFAIPVVAHLLEEIARLLPPDDRDGFGVGGHAVLTVTGCAELRRGLDVTTGMRRHGINRKTNPSAEKRRKQTCAHGVTTSSRVCERCRVYASIQRLDPQSNPGSQGCPSCLRTNRGGRRELACITPPTRVTMPPSRLSRESIAIPVKSSIQVSQTTFIGMETMRSKLMLTLTASAAALLLALANQPVWAQEEPALTGTVSSEAEGNMEGVVVTVAQPGSIVRVSVTTDAQGRYALPQSRLLPGEYTISIRAVGYEIDAPTKAMVEAEKTITTDIRLKKTKNLASQLTNAEWMMSIPGTEEEKAALLNCTGCHTLERIMRSTHDSDEWTHVISRMMGYGAVSQPIKPQPMDRARAGKPEQYRKIGDYLATINLSSADHWKYELKTLPRPKGRDTRAIVTEYDMLRPTTEPHDVLVDKEGNVWYTD